MADAAGLDLDPHLTRSRARDLALDQLEGPFAWLTWTARMRGIGASFGDRES